jgi:hypothetical protein
MKQNQIGRSDWHGDAALEGNQPLHYRNLRRWRKSPRISMFFRCLGGAFGPKALARTVPGRKRRNTPRSISWS